MKNPRLLGVHHDGRRSEVALDVLNPVLDRYEKLILERAIERYRAGHRDGPEALLMLAQLVILDDIRADLKRNVRRGNRAVEKLISGT